MGISYSALLYVGKEFEDQHEATEFLRDTVGLTEQEEDEIAEDGLGEFLYGENRFGLDGDILNYYYSKGGFVLGIKLSPRDPETFAASVEDAFTKWNSLFFEHEQANIIHTMQVS